MGLCSQSAGWGFRKGVRKRKEALWTGWFGREEREKRVSGCSVIVPAVTGNRWAN